MSPRIDSGQLCTVAPVDTATIRVGDIVLCKVRGAEYLHIVKAIQDARFQIGNNRGFINGWVARIDLRQAHQGRAVNLLFDLDGTLTDPVVGITRCIRHALSCLGREAPAEGELARFVGPPLRGTFAELLETTDTALVERAIARYRERFVDVGMFENQVYPDVAGGLWSWRGAATGFGW